MTTFLWIIGSGLLMSAIALAGSVSLLLSEKTLQRMLLPLVAFAAGSLLGGAFFHMLPAAIAAMGDSLELFVWLLVGFTAFLLLEQVLHWHHAHGATEQGYRPLTYLILIGDGLHNFLGGLAVGGAFLADIRLGVAAWLAAAVHEVPQEIGDFGVLVHGGWPRRRALLMNFLSALAFPVGGVLAWAASRAVDVSFLLPLAAGNFIYIAASDLIPEIKGHQGTRTDLVHFAAFVAGLALLYSVARVLG